MAKETSRFASIRGLRDPQERPEAPEHIKTNIEMSPKDRAEYRAAIAPAEGPLETERKRGRPKGKRSNTAEYKPVNLLLRIQTQRSVNRRLEDEESKTDLSELVEQLLQDWLDR